MRYSRCDDGFRFVIPAVIRVPAGDDSISPQCVSRIMQALRGLVSMTLHMILSVYTVGIDALFAL
jgi:hypothetical protein